MSPLLIGMLVVGFGTSAPEMLISAISASQGASGIALGNAWGSNIANIALILGISALVHPVAVRSRILKIELPVLAGVTVLAAIQILNGVIGRIDAAILLAGIAGLVGWSIYESRSANADLLAREIAGAGVGAGGKDAPPPAGGTSRSDAPPPAGGPESGPTLKSHILWLVVGLVVLIASSRILVWGAVGLATAAGISDLVIGLTVVAVGTSLPELASSVAAARRGEDDIAVGNVIGSNLFNTLAVVGIGAMIRPITVDPAVLTRDLPVMAGLTLLLFIVGIGWRGHPGRINRWEGALLLSVYVGYMAMITVTQIA